MHKAKLSLREIPVYRYLIDQLREDLEISMSKVRHTRRTFPSAESEKSIMICSLLADSDPIADHGFAGTCSAERRWAGKEEAGEKRRKGGLAFGA